MFVCVHQFNAPIRSLSIYQPAPNFTLTLNEPYTVAHLEEATITCIHKTFNVSIPLCNLAGKILTPEINLLDMRKDDGTVHVYSVVATLKDMLHLPYLATFSIRKQVNIFTSLQHG
jgi:hypothetical protein